MDRDALKAALDGGPQPLAAAPDPAAGPGDDLVVADDSPLPRSPWPLQPAMAAVVSDASPDRQQRAGHR